LIKIASLTAFGDKDERVKFWGQKVKVKVTVESNMPQNALFGLVIVTCWRRHNNRRIRNYRLVFEIFWYCCDVV